jgi:transposase
MSTLELRADYSAQTLFPPCLEDLVPSDHPVRLIRELLRQLPLGSLGVRMRTAEEGRPSYAPELLLGVWFYGYVEGIYSSRRLEHACRNHLGLLWLTGYHYPDHNTLWRFYASHRAVLPRVFSAMMASAASSGHIGFALHAVDGTRIEGRGSHRGTWHKQDVQQRLKEIEASIERTLQEVERVEAAENAAVAVLTGTDASSDASTSGDPTGGGAALPEALQDPAELRRRVAEALKQQLAALQNDRATLTEAATALQEAKIDHLQPSDREARQLRMPHGPSRFGFNAQITVDAESGMIVTQSVTAQQNDLGLLVPALDQVQTQFGKVAADTVADKGYGSTSELLRLERRGYPATVALHNELTGVGGGPYHATQFHHEGERDVLICPQGQALPLHQVRVLEPSAECPELDAYESRIYHCTASKTCPERTACTTSKQPRRVRLNPARQLIEQQIARQHTPEGRAHLQRRKVIVEPAFAMIKANMKFQRWKAFGLDNAKAEWALIAIAFNLKKMTKLWRAGKLCFS